MSGLWADQASARLRREKQRKKDRRRRELQRVKGLRRTVRRLRNCW